MTTRYLLHGLKKRKVRKSPVPFLKGTESGYITMKYFSILLEAMKRAKFMLIDVLLGLMVGLLVILGGYFFWI